MAYNDRTDIGGTGGEFLTTHWSLIEAVGTTADDRNKALIGLLLNRYWKPVYSYLRRLGYDNEQAKDLTQSFFHEVVLGRELIRKADRSKGRFRSFLLTALKRYLINVRHKRSCPETHTKGQTCSVGHDRSIRTATKLRPSCARGRVQLRLGVVNAGASLGGSRS